MSQDLDLIKTSRKTKIRKNRKIFKTEKWDISLVLVRQRTKINLKISQNRSYASQNVPAFEKKLASAWILHILLITPWGNTENPFEKQNGQPWTVLGLDSGTYPKFSFAKMFPTTSTKIYQQQNFEVVGELMCCSIQQTMSRRWGRLKRPLPNA